MLNEIYPQVITMFVIISGVVWGAYLLWAVAITFSDFIDDRPVRHLVDDSMFKLVTRKEADDGLNAHGVAVIGFLLSGIASGFWIITFPIVCVVSFALGVRAAKRFQKKLRAIEDQSSRPQFAGEDGEPVKTFMDAERHPGKTGIEGVFAVPFWYQFSDELGVNVPLWLCPHQLVMHPDFTFNPIDANDVDWSSETTTLRALVDKRGVPLCAAKGLKADTEYVLYRKGDHRAYEGTASYIESETPTVAPTDYWLDRPACITTRLRVWRGSVTQRDLLGRIKH